MIFYFTATGNCLYAAQKLQQQLEGELYSIPQLLRREQLSFTAAPEEYVGFVFPVFFWGLPDILPRFVSRLQMEGAVPERTFILATMGTTSGSACEKLEQGLAARGIRAGYKFGVPMPDNYVPIFTMPTAEETQRSLEAADTALDTAAEMLLSGRMGDHNRHKGPLPGLVSPLVHLAYPTSTKKFYADSACTGCGLCERVCPVGAIQMADASPRWVRDRCETCLACLHRCPVQAIQYGKDRRAKGRYLNPRVQLDTN